MDIMNFVMLKSAYRNIWVFIYDASTIFMEPQIVINLLTWNYEYSMRVIIKDISLWLNLMVSRLLNYIDDILYSPADNFAS